VKKLNSPVETVINPAALAETKAREPMPHVDDLLLDENGRRLPADHKYREEVRAKHVGIAAGHATYADDLKTDILPEAATRDAKEALLEAAEPRRGLAEEQHANDNQSLRDIKNVPHSVIDPQRKTMSKAAKIGFVIGDTSVLADQLYRSGTPLVLALLVGLSLAMTVVMIGTHVGHESAAAFQRKLRGGRPDDVPVGVRALFDSGYEPDSGGLLGQGAVYAAAGVMFLALFFLGVGSGDPKALALGYGLLGALTVLGSVCAEAYATNEAADQRKLNEASVHISGDVLKEFEGLEADSAAAGTTARLSDVAARHIAVATSATVTNTANRLPDHPDVSGYADGGHLPDPPAHPVPGSEPALSNSRPEPRTRKRPTYSARRGTNDSTSTAAPESPEPESENTSGAGDHQPVSSRNGAKP